MQIHGIALRMLDLFKKTNRMSGETNGLQRSNMIINVREILIPIVTVRKPIGSLETMPRTTDLAEITDHIINMIRTKQMRLTEVAEDPFEVIETDSLETNRDTIVTIPLIKDGATRTPILRPRVMRNAGETVLIVMVEEEDAITVYRIEYKRRDGMTETTIGLATKVEKLTVL